MSDGKQIIPKLIKKEDSLLVIIDLQEKLLPVMSEKETVLENALKLARFAQIIHLPVIVTEQQKLGDTVAELKNELPKARTFGKVSFDCFGEDAIRAAVGLAGRRNLILAGIESHICVAQTAISALENYNVHVVVDAISSRSIHNKEVAVNRMRSSGAVITSTEMVIYELLRQAGTNDFRETLKLVK